MTSNSETTSMLHIAKFRQASCFKWTEPKVCNDFILYARIEWIKKQSTMLANFKASSPSGPNGQHFDYANAVNLEESVE